MARNKAFNLYYINLSKVYEISMMISNVLISDMKKERGAKTENYRKLTSTLSGGFGNKDTLANLKGETGIEESRQSSRYSNVIESFEVKTTKSILLEKIEKRCKQLKDTNGFEEGDLVKIDNIKLDIYNEEYLRQFKVLKGRALNGFVVEGIEISNLISAMLQDYSYILTGIDNNNNDNQYILKIPTEFESEFENKYGIDDLLIGNVSIVGVYKGIVNEEFINNNTFNYLYRLGSQQENKKEKVDNQNDRKIIMDSNSEIKNDETISSGEQNDSGNKSYKYIDVLAIIQNVNFKEEEEKVSFIKKFINFIKARFSKEDKDGEI